MKNFVPLSLFKYLASQKEVPNELSYLTQEHLDAIKAMPLITRGRLSVQDVPQVSECPALPMGFDDAKAFSFLLYLISWPTKRLSSWARMAVSKVS